MQSQNFVEAAPVEVPEQVFENMARSILSSVASFRANPDKEAREFSKSYDLKELIELLRTDTDPYIRENVDYYIEKILLEEPEVLYYDSSSRQNDYETITESYYMNGVASMERDVQSGEYDAGAKLPYLTLAPEDNEQEEDERHYIIPYYTVTRGGNTADVVMPRWINKDGKWVKGHYRSLTIDLTFKTSKGFVTKPLADWVTYYFNEQQKESQAYYSDMQHSASIRNWARYNMLKDQGMPTKMKENYKALLSLHYDFARDVGNNVNIKLRGKLGHPTNPLRAYRDIILNEKPMTISALVIPINN